MPGITSRTLLVLSSSSAACFWVARLQRDGSAPRPQVMLGSMCGACPRALVFGGPGAGGSRRSSLRP
eukprot:538617-Prymnesium_polylepis.2